MFDDIRILYNGSLAIIDKRWTTCVWTRRKWSEQKKYGLCYYYCTRVISRVYTVFIPCSLIILILWTFKIQLVVFHGEKNERLRRHKRRIASTRVLSSFSQSFCNSDNCLSKPTRTRRHTGRRDDTTPMPVVAIIDAV